MSQKRTARLSGLPPGPRPTTPWNWKTCLLTPGYMRRGIATALVGRIAEVLRARGTERLEVTANPDALGYYRAAGFIDCGAAATAFGAAPRMVLSIS